MICAALLAPGRSSFYDVPDLADIRTLGRLLSHMGARVERANGARRGPTAQAHTLHVDASEIGRPEAPYELVKTMRASVLVLGPLVARFGRARVSLPGGCAIGARPIDQHLKGLAALGASIELAHGYVEATAKRLKGARVVFDLPTVTGTENLMMAAALAEGCTTLENCAREPEIEALARTLSGMGAEISGAGTSVITIIGAERLQSAEATVVPDRIEAGTLLCAAVAAGGGVLVRRAPAAHLAAAIAPLREAGAAGRAPGRPEAVDLITAPSPGFPTDLQAQLMACLCVARGASRVVETIFENGFMHAQELLRMGAELT